MNNILEMIKNEKVEWKKLGDNYVSNSVTTGLNPRKNFRLNDSNDGELTCWYITTKDYSVNEKIEFVEGKTAKITENARIIINKRSKLEINDILFSAVGTVGKVALVDINPYNFDVNESTFVIKPNKENIIPKFLVHYLRTDLLQNDVKKFLKGSTLKGIRKKTLLNLQIPIPSLKTQEKIVETLDKFEKYSTELQAELQAELQNRSSQYEYFRDLVLSKDYLNKISMNSEINQNLKNYKIVDLFNTRNGYTPSKSKKEFWDKKEIPWFKMEDIRENGNILNSAKTFTSKLAIKGKAFEKNSIILATSATIGEHALITVPFLANQRFTCFTLKEDFKNKVNMKFMYYYFYIIDKWCINNIKIGNFPSVEVDRLLNQKISIPSIEIQNKVVEVLDKFQNLISDAEGLLPEEIEQRQKQYEYYREKLLTFENNMVQVKSSQVKSSSTL